MQKSSCNLRAGQVLFDSFALPEGIHRPIGAVHKLALKFRVGHSFTHPPQFREQVKEVGSILANWEGRYFGEAKNPRQIYSDSSTQGWGALETQTGQKLQEFWRSEIGLHINIKELKAAIAAVQSLAKPGEVVHLMVDNQVAYHYLRKGGRLPHFNALLRPFLRWCQEKRIILNPNWVKSEDMLADGLRRWSYDTGDYTLAKTLFSRIQKIFSQHQFFPLVHMFASPGNKQLKNFVSRWPHHEAVAVNALETCLLPFQKVYANPPWTMILPLLQRLKDNPHITCLTVVPFWAGSPWWPLLTRMHVRDTPAVVVKPCWGMFQNCLGEDMPPTKWRLLCLLLSGRHYKERKFHLKISTYI